MTSNCTSPLRLQRFLAAVACLLLVCLWNGRAEAAQCHLATAQGSTGPANWQTYCWLDFSSFSNTPARSAAFNQSVAAYSQIVGGRTQMYEPDANNFGAHLGFANRIADADDHGDRLYR